MEGWIVLVSNLHEEAAEEDVTDFFSDFGEVQNIHLNLDRRTGYVKGYALIEYATADEAQRAVTEANGAEMLGKRLEVDFTFVAAPSSYSEKNNRSRSASPTRDARRD